jgi:dedicator of cytokinesis protein 3
VIDSCLKLHGHLCTPEFIPFHATLETFFKKNFREEIRRLAADGISESAGIAPSLTSHSREASHYQSSLYEQSLQRSMSTGSTARGGYIIPAMQVGRSEITPPSQSLAGANYILHASKQTPLQKHLAHVAKHGINGVSSAPGEKGGSDSLSAESPHNSFVNVANAIHSSSGAQMSGASIVTSQMGSLGSFGSLKGRFSRFGSLSFGRRGGSSS